MKFGVLGCCRAEFWVTLLILGFSCLGELFWNFGVWCFSFKFWMFDVLFGFARFVGFGDTFDIWVWCRVEFWIGLLILGFC